MAETSPRPASLLDQIKQNLSQMAQPAAPAGSILGQTEALQRISQAASGQAAPTAPTGAPARSRQAELAVVDQVKRGQEELAKQNQIQQLAFAQQQQAIEEGDRFKNSLLSEEQLNARDKYLETQKNILGQYVSGQRQLDLNKDKSRLEQLGFTMRLGNDKYLTELDRQAKVANLRDALSFEEEMYRTIFADEEELLRNNLDFRAMLSADERQFREEMANISIDMALELAMAENKALSEKQMWDGVSDIASAGALAYGKGLFDTEEEKQPGLGGTLT